MATRRAAATANQPKDDPLNPDLISSLSSSSSSSTSTKRSNTSPAVPWPVIAKLLLFTFAMITLPISTYFFSVSVLFPGRTTVAGALAAVMANVVLIGYVVAAFREDQTDREEEERRAKKGM